MKYIVTERKQYEIHTFVDMLEAIEFIKWKRQTQPDLEYVLFELKEVFNTTDLGR